jgi:AraC family transcriptional regulator
VRLKSGEYFGTREHVANLAGLTISRAVYQPRTRLPRHSHSQAYLCLVASGAFEERGRGRLETCASGTTVWNPSGHEHEDRFGDAGAQTWNLEFQQHWSERIAQVTETWTVARSVEVSWLVGRILRELARPDTSSALALEGTVCALLGELSRDPATAERRVPSWLSRAQSRLREEYRLPPTVGELAREAGVHRSHFARAFTRHYGTTVAEFVRRLRIDWAAEQLRTGNWTLSQLSLDAGFGDQAHFTRTFKRITGITPGQYRASVVQPK